MEMKDFEVGKKYRHPSWSKKVVLICVGHTTAGIPIMENSVGDAFKISSWAEWKEFVEYREPREFLVIKFENGEYGLYPSFSRGKAMLSFQGRKFEKERFIVREVIE